MNLKHKAPAGPVLPADDLALVPTALVMPIVGLKESAIRTAIIGGQFPQPLRLAPRCVRFRAGDIRAWLADPLGWNPGKAIDANAAAPCVGALVEA